MSFNPRTQTMPGQFEPGQFDDADSLDGDSAPPSPSLSAVPSAALDAALDAPAASESPQPSILEPESEDTIKPSTYKPLGPPSPYSLLLNGQIGSTSDLTMVTSNGYSSHAKKISRNVGLASANIRRNPTRKENLEMSATLRFPAMDIYPEYAYQLPAMPAVSPPVQILPPTQKATTKRSPASAPQQSREAEYKTYVKKLEEMDSKSKHWSLTGKKYDVKFKTLKPHIQKELLNGTPLGSGGYGTVHRVIVSGIPIARKSIRLPSSNLMNDIKSEVENVQNLAGHQHIIKLVGTYLTTDEYGDDMFHILTFPVADCDMDWFLNNYELSLEPRCDPTILSGLSLAAGIKPSASRYTPTSALLRAFLKQTLGCITSAIKWMHNSSISHDDIKPANILLLSGQVYMTDFGISRNRKGAVATSTEFDPGRTHGWTAPEKEMQLQHNPYHADVYSLGCVFMHVLNLLSNGTRKDCGYILQSPPKRRGLYIKEHFRGLDLEAFKDGTQTEKWRQLVELTEAMLLDDRRARPVIGEVEERLWSIGGDGRVFHGSCCRHVSVQATDTLRPKSKTEDKDEAVTVKPAQRQLSKPGSSVSTQPKPLAGQGSELKIEEEAETATIKPKAEDAPVPEENYSGHV